MAKRFFLSFLIVMFVICGLHLIYEAYILKTKVIDGTGVGFHPFGLDLAVNNKDIFSTSLTTFVVGLVFLIISGVLSKLIKNKTK